MFFPPLSVDLPGFCASVYYTLIAISLTFKLVNIFRRSFKRDPAFARFELRFIFCAQLMQSVLTFQAPYTYQCYIDNGMSNEQISWIILVSNIASCFFSLAAGFLPKTIQYNLLISVAFLASGAASFCRANGSFGAFIGSGILVGLAGCSSQLGLDEWNFSALSHYADSPLYFSVLSEDRGMVKFIFQLMISPLGRMVYTEYDVHVLFTIGGLTFVAGGIIVAFVAKQTTATPSASRPASASNKVGMWEAIKDVAGNRRTAAVCLLSVAMSVGSSLFHSRISGHMNCKECLASLHGSFALSGLIGAQVTAALTRHIDSGLFVLLYFLLGTTARGMIYVDYTEKALVFVGICIDGIVDGGLMPLVNSLKQRTIKPIYRTSTMSMLRLVSSLISSLLLFVMNRASAEEFLLAAIVAFGSGILFGALYYLAPKEKED